MVTIDRQSGFCFGVVTAIRKAEEELQKGNQLYCLGDIVHNEQEVERLTRLGLKTIDHQQFATLHHAKVLLRAHGEPPETYRIAAENDIEIVDASCPVVRNLQQKIRRQYQLTPHAQIVIFGKTGHAEVVGLQGQTDNNAIVVEHAEDADKLDVTNDIYLFSQTTKSADDFRRLVDEIEQRRKEQHTEAVFEWHDTICGQVRNRVQHLQEFARSNDRIVFVGGRNSSNAKVLFEHCRKVNPDTVFISDEKEITDDYIAACRDKNVGICGATSTPLWLMQRCAEKIENKTI